MIHRETALRLSLEYSATKARHGGALEADLTVLARAKAFETFLRGADQGKAVAPSYPPSPGGDCG